MFEVAPARPVYLPPGEWVDLQTKATHLGPGWVTLAPGEIPAILLARGGSAIPTVAPAAHTGALDFGHVSVWSVGSADVTDGSFASPRERQAKPLRVVWEGGRAKLAVAPGAAIEWSIERIGADAAGARGAG